MCGDQNQQTAKYIHELCVEFRADLCAGRCPTRYAEFKEIARSHGPHPNHEALAGNMNAMGMVLDRIEGKCPQIIEAPGGGVSLVLAMVAEMDRVTAPGAPAQIEAKPDGE